MCSTSSTCLSLLAVSLNYFFSRECLTAGLCGFNSVTPVLWKQSSHNGECFLAWPIIEAPPSPHPTKTNQHGLPNTLYDSPTRHFQGTSSTCPCKYGSAVRYRTQLSENQCYSGEWTLSFEPYGTLYLIMDVTDHSQIAYSKVYNTIPQAGG